MYTRSHIQVYIYKPKIFSGIKRTDIMKAGRNTRNTAKYFILYITCFDVMIYPIVCSIYLFIVLSFIKESYDLMFLIL